MRRIFRLLAKTITVYAFLGFVLVPPTVHLLVTRLLAPNYLNIPLHLGGVFFNPFTLELRLESLILGERNQPVAGVKAGSVELGWRSLAGEIHIQSIRLDGASADIVLSDSGTLNVFNWLKVSGNALSNAPSNDKSDIGNQEGSMPLNLPIVMDSFEINNASLSFTDLQIEAKTGQPFTLTFDDINASLVDLIWPEGESEFIFSTNINGAALNVFGTISLPAPAITIQHSLSQLDLTDFQPYISLLTFLNVDSGFLSVTSKSSWSEDQGAQSNSLLQLDKLDIKDSRDSEDIVGWNRLLLSDIQFNETQSELNIKQLSLDKPQLRVLIGEHFDLNLANLARPPRDQDDIAQGSASTEKSTLRFRLEDIQLNDGAVYFSDQSFNPGFVAPISSLNGSITGIDSQAGKNLDLSLRGQVSHYSPVRMTASVNPFSPMDDTRVHLAFDDIELTTLTPYSNRFAGYIVERGRMDLSLDYLINHSQLSAHNAMLLDKLTLGERVESDEAVGVPLRLAIALLKDRNGQIDIQLPVSGDLNNPDFKLGPVLGMAATNMLMNVVSAPFNFLASLVGSDSDDLSTIYFRPGDVYLSAGNQRSIQQLASALQERPELELDIAGFATLKEDWPLVASTLLEQQLQQEHSWDQMSGNERLLLLQAQAEKLEIEDTDSLNTQELLGQLVDNMPFNEGALRTLAIERSRALKRSLVENGLNPERVYILDVKTPESSGSGQGVQAKMELRAG